MKIYDKADWQMDGGIPKEVVIRHFKLVFEWLQTKNFLNSDGIEIFELGDFTNASLNDSLLTKEGNDFVESNYDKLMKEVPYGDEGIINRLDTMMLAEFRR